MLTYVILEALDTKQAQAGSEVIKVNRSPTMRMSVCPK